MGKLMETCEKIQENNEGKWEYFEIREKYREVKEKKLAEPTEKEVIEALNQMDIEDEKIIAEQENKEFKEFKENKLFWFERMGVNGNCVGLYLKKIGKDNVCYLSKNQLKDDNDYTKWMKKRIIREWEAEQEKRNKELVAEYEALPENEKRYFGDEG